MQEDPSRQTPGCYGVVVVDMIQEWENVGIVVGVVAGVMVLFAAFRYFWICDDSLIFSQFINILMVFTFALMMGPKTAYEPV